MTFIAFRSSRFVNIDVRKHYDRLTQKFDTFSVPCPHDCDLDVWQRMLDDRRHSWIQKTLSFVMSKDALQRKGSQEYFLPSPEAMNHTIFRDSKLNEVCEAALVRCNSSNFLEIWNPVATNLILLLEQSRISPTSHFNSLSTYQRNAHFGHAWHLCFGHDCDEIGQLDFRCLNVLSLLKYGIDSSSSDVLLRNCELYTGETALDAIEDYFENICGTSLNIIPYVTVDLIQ